MAGRPKKSIKKEEKNPTPKKVCTGECKKEQAITNFYNSNSNLFADGKAPICKKCLKKMINYDYIDTIYDVLQSIDVPFIETVWESCSEAKGDTFGTYLRQINSLPQYANMRWKNSSFTNELTEFDNGIVTNKPSISKAEKQRLVEKWGYYDDEELLLFERKFDALKNNYPQKTAMHTEALLTYIRYRVKEEISTCQGNVTEAQKWGQLADKASERAKINPSQLSKADLSGGLNGFGELSRAVEKAIDMYDILPRFKERPQDKVDFTLWCYINYCRRLKNLPDADYKDIWKFYNDRKEEYKLKDTEREFKFEDEK